MVEVSEDDIAWAERQIVTDIAPEELLLFRMHSEAFFRDPRKALAPPKSKEDALGFGAGEAATVITPFVLMAVKTVFALVAQDVGRELGAQTRIGLRSLVQRLFGPRGVDSVALTTTQLQQIHAAALANSGPDPAIARRIADGILKALNPNHK
jgi:hypothetical protein